MPEVIEQLRSYGEAVEAAVPEVEWTVPRNRRPLLVAAAALVVLAGVASAVWVLQRNGEDARPPVVSTAPQPPTATATGWQTLTPPPIAPREGAALVWTDDELVVWGGPREQSQDDGYADGAAYDAATGTWRPMSPSPLRGGSAVGVWTGEEVLLWSVRDQLDDRWAGAAWSPSTDTWRLLARPPQIEVDGRIQPVWTGQLMIDVASGAVYDPATDRWGDLPERPVDGPVQASVWTGTEVLTLIANRSDGSYPAGEAVALAFDPTPGTWQALPPTGVGATAADLAWDGEQAVAVDYEMQAATFRPGEDRWRALPPLPLRFYECAPSLARLADTVLATHCSGDAVLTEDRTWAIGSPPALAAARLVTTGDVVFGWWSSDESYNFPDAPVSHFQQFTAPPLDGLALAPTIPIGTVLLDLPDGTRLIGTDWTEDDFETRLSYDLDGDGGRCRLASSYGGPPAVRIRNQTAGLEVQLDTERLQVDLGRWTATVARVPPGQIDADAHILLEETTTDLLDISCPDLSTAEDLLAGIHR
jgi:hypothetical protein